MQSDNNIKALKSNFIRRIKCKQKYQSIWLVRLNARMRIYEWNYNFFTYYIRQKKNIMNRKVLVNMAIYNIEIFITLFR